MRLGTAIERLVDNYRYASDKEWINDKVAWALYHTWKEADDRKTENSSEKPNNCEDEQMETQTETQNSNLTFEKVMEEIQTQVIEFPDTHQKFTFARKIEMDGDSIKIGGWEYKGVKDGEREGE